MTRDGEDELVAITLLRHFKREYGTDNPHTVADKLIRAFVEVKYLPQTKRLCFIGGFIFGALIGVYAAIAILLFMQGGAQ